MFMDVRNSYCAKLDDSTPIHFRADWMCRGESFSRPSISPCFAVVVRYIDRIGNRILEKAAFRIEQYQNYFFKYFLLSQFFTQRTDAFMIYSTWVQYKDTLLNYVLDFWTQNIYKVRIS